MKKEDREPRCRICIGALFRGRAPFSGGGNPDIIVPDLYLEGGNPDIIEPGPFSESGIQIPGAWVN